MKQWKLKTLAAVLMSAAVVPAYAVNWFQLQGNEAPGAPAYKIWGFAQPTYTWIKGTPVTGLLGAASAYNGQVMLNNRVGPDLDKSEQAQLLRARLGVRGVMPGTDEKINYFVLAEVGDNGTTYNRNLTDRGVSYSEPIVLTDASMTFNYIPGARIRAGLMRLPMGEEAMQAVQVMDYINFTNATDVLLNERFLRYDAAGTQANAPLPTGSVLQRAMLIGPTGAFRDVGVQVYDWFNKGRWEYAYALMASQGNGLEWTNGSGSGDLTGRLQASYVFEGRGLKRQDITFFMWEQDGERSFNNQTVDRMRRGLGFKFVRGPWRVGAEYIDARGMIWGQPAPQFTDLTSATLHPVQTVGLNSTAEGYYIDVGWKLNKQWEFDWRYDELDRFTDSKPDQRNQKTYTYGVQYFYNPKLRFALNYERRDGYAPYLSSIQPAAQQSNVSQIGHSLDDRVTLQATWLF